MSPAEVLTVVGALVAVAAAYHIAVRQGAFKRGDLLVRPAALDDEASRETPWLIVLAVPTGTQPKKYVVVLPWMVSAFGRPFTHVWYQVAHTPEFVGDTVERLVGNRFADLGLSRSSHLGTSAVLVD